MRPLRISLSAVSLLSSLTLFQACHSPREIVDSCTTDSECAPDELCDVVQKVCHSASPADPLLPPKGTPSGPDGGGGDAGTGNTTPDAGTWAQPIDASPFSVEFPGAEAIDVKLDGMGRVHVALSTEQGGIQYGSCQSGCVSPADFSLRSVYAGGVVPPSVRLQLSPNGLPRIAFFAKDTAAPGTGSFHVATCSGACATADWSDAPVISNLAVPSDVPDYFKVSASGRNGLLLPIRRNAADDGIYLTSCEGDCLNPSDWTSLKLTATAADDLSLAYRSDGTWAALVSFPTSSLAETTQLRLFQQTAASAFVDSGPLFLGCGWREKDTHRRLSLTRVADGFAAAYFAPGNGGYDRVAFGRCNADCGTLTSWTTDAVFPSQMTYVDPMGLDASIDEAGNRRVSFVNRFKSVVAVSAIPGGSWHETAVDDFDQHPAPEAMAGCGNAYPQRLGSARARNVMGFVVRQENLACAAGSGVPRYTGYVAKVQTL